MKKQEIKSAVERAKSQYMPKAIKEEAEYRARDEVRKALFEEPEDEVAGPAEPKEAPQKPASVRIQANDPRLAGRQ